MKKINLLMIVVTMLFGLMACGSKDRSLGELVKSNFEMPGDPTGDIDTDARALAGYMCGIMSVTTEVGKYMDTCKEKYKDNKEFDNGFFGANANTPEDSVTYDDVEELTAELGDSIDSPRRAGELLGLLTMKVMKLSQDMMGVVAKYESYYKDKGEGDMKKFEAAFQKLLPEDIKKEMGL